MPALSFSVFRDKIESGAKRQTIRSIRKRAIAAGDKLFLYWKQQSPKDCEKLGEATCSKVSSIFIDLDGIVLNDQPQVKNLNEFAIADGFNNWHGLIDYFNENYTLPFTGVLIEWDSIN